MKCPRCHKNEATQDRTYGVLPCRSCQEKDEQYAIRGFTEQHPIGKYDRIQKQRDKHIGDTLQPYQSGHANVDFFRRYPDKVKDYDVKSELEKA